MHWPPSWWYKGWQLSSLKGVRRIPTLQPRLQTRHRVPCKQDFRFKLLWRKERRSGICKTGFPNFQIGASFEACSSLTWSSGDRLHFAGTMCLSSPVFKIPNQKNTKLSTKIHPFPLQHSYKELLLLIFLILVSGIIFASLAYFIEIEEVLWSYSTIAWPIWNNLRTLVLPQFQLPCTGWWSPWPLSATVTSIPPPLLARYELIIPDICQFWYTTVKVHLYKLWIWYCQTVFFPSWDHTIFSPAGRISVRCSWRPRPLSSYSYHCSGFFHYLYLGFAKAKMDFCNKSFSSELWGFPHGDQQEKQVNEGWRVLHIASDHIDNEECLKFLISCLPKMLKSPTNS